METLFALLTLREGNPPVTGGFPSQRSVMRSFDSFYLRLKKRLNKQSKRRWFATPARSLWRHCNDKAPFYSLWPCDATWRHRSGSRLDHVMARLPELVMNMESFTLELWTRITGFYGVANDLKCSWYSIEYREITFSYKEGKLHFRLIPSWMLKGIPASYDIK